jgi:hypothetical protein
LVLDRSIAQRHLFRKRRNSRLRSRVRHSRYTSDDWAARQQLVLTRHATVLRGAGAKAWNVYSVFLTADHSASKRRAIERIEEDFSLTRKIVCAGVRTADDVDNAVLPLTAVWAQPLLRESNFEVRLRSRLKEMSSDAVTAFLGKATPEEVARILGGA